MIRKKAARGCAGGRWGDVPWRMAVAGAACLLGGTILTLAGCGGSSKDGDGQAAASRNEGPAPLEPLAAAPGNNAPAPQPATTPAPPAGTSTQPEAPPVSTPDATPGSTHPAPPPAAAKPVSWGPEKIVRSIPLPEADVPAVLGPPGSPFLFDGRSVIDVTTGKSLGTLEDTWDKIGPERALSSDGRAYAVAHDDDKGRQTMVSILATMTGEPVHGIQVPQGDDRFGTEVEYLRFSGPRTLLVICRRSLEHLAVVYDVNSGKVTKQFKVAGADERRTDCSPDGKYLVTGGLDKASIYEIETGREIARLVEPPKEGLKSFLYAGPLAFSPAGNEIAALLGRRVICWNLDGAIVYDEPCGQDNPMNEQVQWIPDGSGWLVRNRFLMLREPKLVVWELRDKGTPRFIDRDRLFIFRDGYSDREVVLFPVPWEHLDGAVAALKSGAPALLKPGDSVSLDIQVGQTRFSTPQEAEKQLRDAFTELCAASGIQVADGSRHVLSVQYSEAAGETREVVEGSRIPTPFSKPRSTGQRLQETTCRLHARLALPDREEPLWETDYDSGRSYSVFGEATDAAMRKQVFDMMLFRLKQGSIPCFIPQEPGTASLPLISELKP